MNLSDTTNGEANAAERYLTAARALLQDLWETQLGGIERAAGMIAETLQRDGIV